LEEHLKGSGGRGDLLSLRLEESRRFAAKALEKYSGIIKSIVLFGPVAKGEVTPESDANIFLILDDTAQE